MKKILQPNNAIIAIKRTNLTKERGKYAIVIKKEMGREARNFLDAACQFLTLKTPDENKHNTHPEIRRSSPNRWLTQIQIHAETLTYVEDGPLPRKPPNTWTNRVVLLNLLGNGKPKSNPSKTSSRPSQAPVKGKQVDVEQKLKEIEERLNKSIDERLER